MRTLEHKLEHLSIVLRRRPPYNQPYCLRPNLITESRYRYYFLAQQIFIQLTAGISYGQPLE